MKLSRKFLSDYLDTSDIEMETGTYDSNGKKNNSYGKRRVRPKDAIILEGGQLYEFYFSDDINYTAYIYFTDMNNKYMSARDWFDSGGAVYVPANSKAKEWIKKVEEYSDEIDEKTLVLFLINDENIYAAIKKHSLCKNAYISQVVKNSTVMKKGLISICSKILLQVNSKLGGISYTLKFDDDISNMNLMAVLRLTRLSF